MVDDLKGKSKYIIFNSNKFPRKSAELTKKSFVENLQELFIIIEVNTMRIFILSSYVS